MLTLVKTYFKNRDHSYFCR